MTDEYKCEGYDCVKEQIFHLSTIISHRTFKATRSHADNLLKFPFSIIPDRFWWV
jgi:hypothetical protein